MTLEHGLYLLFAFSLIISINIGAHFIKSERIKEDLLIVLALTCFFVHISNIYIVYLNNNGSTAGLTWVHLFPVYFCNLMMGLLVVVSLWPQKKTKFFNGFATFVAWGSIFGGLITNFTTFYGWTPFINFSPNFTHTLMIVLGVYMFVTGYAKLNVYNLVPGSIGLLFCGLIGVLTKYTFDSHGLETSGEMGNPMFLYDGIAGFESLNGFILAIIFIVLIFLFTATWEFFTRKKEDRWYKTIKDLWLYIPYFPSKKNKVENKVENKNSESN